MNDTSDVNVNPSPSDETTLKIEAVVEKKVVPRPVIRYVRVRLSHLVYSILFLLGVGVPSVIATYFYLQLQGVSAKMRDDREKIEMLKLESVQRNLQQAQPQMFVVPGNGPPMMGPPVFEQAPGQQLPFCPEGMVPVMPEQETNVY